MPAIPKWGLYGIVVVGGAGIAYAIWKYNKNQKAAATSAATASQGQYGYGSTVTPQSYGYGSGQGGYGYGSYTYDPYGQNYGYGSYNSGLPEPPSAGAVTTNAQWVQAAVSALTAPSIGYTGTTVLAALGKYVTGQPLSASDEGIVSAAIGAEGYPPVPGPTGYPPAMNPGGGGGGTGAGGNVTVPNVVGMKVGAAHNAMVHAGLKAGSEHINTSYVVTAQVPAAGTSVPSGTTFSLTAKKG